MTVATDAPDWTRSTAYVPTALATVVMTAGATTASQTYSQIPLCTGVVVQCFAEAAAVTTDRVTVEVLGGDTDTVYAEAVAEQNSGIAILALGAAAIESSFTVKVTWQTSFASTVPAAKVWALFGPQAMQPVAPPEQPLFVATSRARNVTDDTSVINSADTTAAGDSHLFDVVPSGSAVRYLRRVDIMTTWLAATPTGAWTVYLKGHTSGLTKVIYTGAQITGAAGIAVVPIDYGPYPLDLLAKFPNDAVVELHAVAAASQSIAVTAITTT